MWAIAANELPNLLMTSVSKSAEEPTSLESLEYQVGH